MARRWMFYNFGPKGIKNIISQEHLGLLLHDQEIILEGKGQFYATILKSLSSLKGMQSEVLNIFFFQKALFQKQNQYSI